MKTPIAPGALTEGITRLARAARPPGKRSARRGGAPGGSFVLAKPSPALATDEVLIAVADASSVVFIAQAEIARVVEAAETIVQREALMAQALREGGRASDVMGANYEHMLKK